MYFDKISTLKIANRNISQVIKVNPKVEYKPHENSRIINKLSYEDILSISKKHSLKLDEFRYSGKPSAKYQIIVKGSWLNVREFLYELTTIYQYILFIESLDFQRDQLTNEVSLNILISTGENDEITSESSS